MSAIEELFEEGGLLSSRIDGFSPRSVQAQMAARVASALDEGSLQLIEAGTGTGKTFAYLVPALLAGLRVIVSTGTKNLQDQLFERDLPRLLEVLAVPARTAMLKGRGNYLCLYRMARAGQRSAGRSAALPAWKLAEVERWSRSTERGEVSELGSLVEEDRLRFAVTSTADNCLGNKCPDFNDCFVVKSRRAAMGADLVVANHHVLLSDVLLKEEGFGEILPGADAVIVDEAHQLPELASQFFGTRVTSRQCRDFGDEMLKLAAEFPELPSLHEQATDLAAPVIALETRLAGLPGRMVLQEFIDRHGGDEVISRVQQCLAQAGDLLLSCRDHSQSLDVLAQRGQRILTNLQRCADGAEEDAHVRWVEPLGRGGALHATPLELAEGFARVFASHTGAWVLTSATLSAAGDFSHIRSQIGVPEASSLALDSPFDYQRQTRLYLPSGLPEPAHEHYLPRVAALCGELIQASGGGAFVLCTSYRSLRGIAEQLRRECSFPILVQGEDDRARLVERFAGDGNAVLVGTQSFWEGVDVKGRALRLVIIDKLPFAAPGDPVQDARLAALRQRGGSPFMEVQLPQAIVNLRQGAGRLIRDETDRGLLVLCDPRLQSKLYGRKMLASLPAMPRVDHEQAIRWLDEMSKT